MMNRRMAGIGFVVLAIVVSLWMAGAAMAATWYVRSGANGAGDGSDWQNAFPDLPADLRRGDTYYVATGVYGSYTFDDPGSELITIKKATAINHGTEQGWQSSYGIGAAVWRDAKWTFLASNYVIDGVVGEGRSGHGFKMLKNIGSKFAGGLIRFGDVSGVSDIRIRHLEVDAIDPQQWWDLQGTCPQVFVYSLDSSSRITLSHLYVHDVYLPFLIRGWTDFTLEYSHIVRNWGNSSCHSEAVSTHGGARHTYRHNVFEDIGSTAVLSHLAGATSQWKVHGNVFYWTANGRQPGDALWLVREGSSATDIQFINNSVHDESGNGHRLTPRWAGTVSGAVVQNNIWHNLRQATLPGGSDYNVFLNVATVQGSIGSNDIHVPSAPMPFLDPSALNFALNAEIIGRVQEPVYQLDPTGRMRGADGVWDRGAIEFATGAALPPPPAPTNLSIR